MRSRRDCTSCSPPTLADVAPTLPTVEVARHGGPYSIRDLYPYQLALAQIDNLRQDGIFYGHDQSIPEGQAVLTALLSEAHEIVSMMQEENEQMEAEAEAEETGTMKESESQPASASASTVPSESGHD